MTVNPLTGKLDRALSPDGAAPPTEERASPPGGSEKAATEHARMLALTEASLIAAQVGELGEQMSSPFKEGVETAVEEIIFRLIEVGAMEPAAEDDDGDDESQTIRDRFKSFALAPPASGAPDPTAGARSVGPAETPGERAILLTVLDENAEIIHAGHAEESWEVCTTPRCTRLRSAFVALSEASSARPTPAKTVKGGPMNPGVYGGAV